MKSLALVGIVATSLLSGCAGFNNAVAERVESVGVNAGGTYNKETGDYGANVGTNIVLRDPRKGGTAK